MKFAWQIADGMSYLSSKRVCNVLIYWHLCFVPLLVYWGFARCYWKRLTPTVSTMSSSDNLNPACEFLVKGID